jgi:hypothetical protein
MSTLIVLFRLKPGVDRQAYENWARTTDLPVVRDLPSVNAFDVYRVSGLLRQDAAAPYDYAEVIDLRDQDEFLTDVTSDTMRRVAAAFRTFADNPLFLVTASLEVSP